MGQRGVLQVGDDLLDDRVAAVGRLGLDQRGGVVGEQGVVAPRGEQRVLQLRGVAFGIRRTISRAVTCLAAGRDANAVYSHFGDLGGGDQFTGVGVGDRPRILDAHPRRTRRCWRSRRVPGSSAASRRRTGHRLRTAGRIAEEQYAESARTRIGPAAPHRRAVAIASRSIRTAPWAEGAAPRRSRVAAITGAACGGADRGQLGVEPADLGVAELRALLTRTVDTLDGVIDVDHAAWSRSRAAAARRWRARPGCGRRPRRTGGHDRT